MNKYLVLRKYAAIAGFIISCFLSFQVQASHCAGGQLVYKHLPNTPDSTYHIIFKLYRDCSGSTAGNSVMLCYRNTCMSGSAGSIALTKSVLLPNGDSNGRGVDVGCPNSPTTCKSANSSLPGYEEWWYEGNVTLPTRCANWEFSVAIGARNMSNNLIGTGNIFYVKATLNNITAQGNSSPDFTVQPVAYVCLNGPYTFNNGVVDQDGDSLAYSMITPLKSASATPCSDYGVNLAYAPAGMGQPPYNSTTNPLACNNTFQLNQFGQMGFTAAQLGAYTLTMQVKEYRNHQLIGSVMRDIQIRVLSCNGMQPTAVFDTTAVNITGGQWVNGRIENCANTPVHFCFSFHANDTSLKYIATDNHFLSATTSVVGYGGQYSHNVMGCFNWLPGNNDTGIHVFTVTVKEASCKPPGIAVSYTYSYPVYIAPVATTNNDTSICVGNSVQLTASGGSAFTWTALPGGSGMASLSCTNCYNPVAHPSVTTKYVVTSNVVSFCNRNKDTVTITVHTPPPAPAASSNNPLCQGQDLKLFAGVSAGSYVWKGPGGFNATTANPVIANAQLSNSGIYKVVAKNGNCSSPPATINVVVSAVPQTPVITGKTAVCEADSISLTASGTPGAIYTWNGPAGYCHTGTCAAMANAQLVNAGNYSVVAANPANHFCKSITTVQQVAVLPHLTADFTISADSICQNETVRVIFTGTGSLYKLDWGWGKGAVLNGSKDGPYTIRYDSAGVETINVVTSNAGCSDSIAKKLVVKSIPPASFRLQPDACIGELIQLGAARNIDPNLHFDWQFGDATVFKGADKGSYSLYYQQPGYKVISLQTSSAACKSFVYTDTVYVHPDPIAQITSLNRNDVCSGDTVVLWAEEALNYHYKWSPAISFYENDARTVSARVFKTGFLDLQVKDDYGCSSHDSVYVNARPCCEVGLPNAFTPNGDGRNDLFRIVTAGHHDISGFRVFNRWGQTVFETADETRGWDGQFAGVGAPAGTYFYYLRYRCTNNQYYEQKGELTLIR